MKIVARWMKGVKGVMVAAKVSYLPWGPGSRRWLAAVVAAAVLVPSLAAGLDWTIETVDPGKQFSHMTDRSLRLDASGYPHVVYGGDHLYYARYDGSTWHYETVDASPGVGKHASLALDASGFEHIAYYDESAGNLKYACRDASGWHIETVDGPADVGTYTSIGVDGTGYPHISYYDVSSGDLKYARKDASGWHIHVVDGQGNVGQYTSLVVDSLGFVHVAYYDATNGDLKYAWRGLAGWQATTVDSPGDVGRFPSIALAPGGYPRIAYVGGPYYYDLRHAFKDASGWHTESVQTWPYSMASASLAVDAEGHSHIFYCANDELVLLGYMLYAEWTGSGWDVEEVGTPCNWPGATGASLCLDACGNPHATCQDGQLLQYRHKADGSWFTSDLDYGGSISSYNSLVSQWCGYPHIAYFAGMSLRYARRDGFGWGFETADGTSGVGWHVLLALDAAGYPHAAYYDFARGDLRYAHRDGAGWHVDVVDSSGDVGSWTSLGLDQGGHPHISYYDADNGDLKYASNDGSGWLVETVDSEGSVGMSNSLAVDGSGYACIAYHDDEFQNNRLRYASRDASGWHIERVDSSWYGCAFPSLALDQLGRPHISYDGEGDLRHAYKDASGWHAELVADLGWLHGTSLALDTEGFAHISYIQESPPGTVGYAYEDAGGWHTEAIDGADECPTSLSLDQSGCPNISYCSSGNLMYAYAGSHQIAVAAGLQAGQLVLTWAPFPPTVQYWVYGAANEAYFEPGSAPGYQYRLAALPSLFYTWSTANGIGDPDSNWTYLVLAIDAYGQEMCRSNRVGEHDFGTGN